MHDIRTLDQRHSAMQRASSPDQIPSVPERFKRQVVLVAAAVGLAVGSTAHAETCTNDTLLRIMERGKVVVGVKADYKPWGFKNSDGEIVGMEIDMAQGVGKLSALWVPTTTPRVPMSCLRKHWVW